MAFLQTKALLAKLLATENVDVRHDTSVTTASFDTHTRVLTLPVLNTESEHLYNLFVAHEVGHALQTPDKWTKDIPANVPFDFVNVIEDVRIEKYIQGAYPGLKKDFYKGYAELHDRDFFDLGDKDLSKFSFIDRINLHYKGGTHLCIPFTDEELVYVQAVDECVTYEDVCDLLNVYNYIGQKQQDKTDTEPQQDGESGESQDQSPQSNSNSNSDDTQQGDDKSDGATQDDTDDEGDDDSVDETQSTTQKSMDENMESMAKNDFENRL